MDYRPNSWPERTGPFMTYTNTLSRDIGPDEDRGHSPIRSLNEHFVMKRAIKQWTSPKHPNYNLIDARLDSFQNWPRGSPSPETLSEAGFFFSGMYRQFLVYFKFSKCFVFTYTQNFWHFQGEGIRQFAFAVGLVFTNGYHQTMRGKNTHVCHLIVFCQIHQKPCFCSWE